MPKSHYHLISFARVLLPRSPTFRSQKSTVVPAFLVDVVDAQFGPIELRLNLSQGRDANLLVNLRREEDIMLWELMQNLLDNLADWRGSEAKVQALHFI